MPRERFDGTALDLHGKRPFTLIAWVKFVGERHLVAGIWDEGGWDRYEGMRQVALFAGLFQQKGVIAHISATGAASFPQSTIPGSQYARIRAIDGKAFEDDQWIAMGMTYDPQRKEVKAYLNGEMTLLTLTDPVTQSVFEYAEEQLANPLPFDLPVFSPRSFLIKFNGYFDLNDGIKEHHLFVDLANESANYRRLPADSGSNDYRVSVDVIRNERSLLRSPLALSASRSMPLEWSTESGVMEGDTVTAILEVESDDGWRQVGSRIQRVVRPGAPFTFGRALGLGSEEIEHGSQLYMDGVAVFNRVLSSEELKALSFGL